MPILNCKIEVSDIDFQLAIAMLNQTFKEKIEVDFTDGETVIVNISELIPNESVDMCRAFMLFIVSEKL